MRARANNAIGRGGMVSAELSLREASALGRMLSGTAGSTPLACRLRDQGRQLLSVGMALLPAHAREIAEAAGKAADQETEEGRCLAKIELVLRAALVQAGTGTLLGRWIGGEEGENAERQTSNSKLQMGNGDEHEGSEDR